MNDSNGVKIPIEMNKLLPDVKIDPMSSRNLIRPIELATINNFEEVNYQNPNINATQSPFGIPASPHIDIANPINSNYPGHGGGTVVINGIVTPIPDYNLYQQKKTLSQGMIDLSLITANCNQLRYVLDTVGINPYFYISIVLIVTSIVFQIAIGVGLIINSRYNVANKIHICKANKINNYTLIGVFIVTVVNAFISTFAVTSQNIIIASQPAVITASELQMKL